MAKKKNLRRAAKHHDSKPALIKRTAAGEQRIMPRTELDKLEEQRQELVSSLEEIDKKILELKRERQQELLTELRSLGLDEVPQVRTAAGTKIKRPRNLSKPCPICGIAGHDKRAHRNHPKPFTPEELKERNLPTA